MGFFFCICFIRLSLLLNLDEMGHSETSIYVTLLLMVMVILKISFFFFFERQYKILFSLCERKGDIERKLIFKQSCMMSFYVLLHTMK